ncbi:MAG: Zn-dependent hydrolase [Deltaproteobacteria bacterium]|nr:Zn-dependent hydrolase [Deltaproteobacteria bacterium]MBW2120293.1 Zn-dependent hydrolase [Deltaproteobacteria bacterium]
MASRLKQDLIETGRFGRSRSRRIERYDQLDGEAGVIRPTGTEENKRLRDYAVARMKEAGLAVRIDKVGNIFGRREGSKTNEGAVMSGSHLDSVINGGMFDGALGVFGAIEAVRRMNEEGFGNERPLEVAVLTGEEGSAFGQVLLGSSVLIGKLSVDEALGIRNSAGQTLDEALRGIGYRGDFERTLDDVGYFVEMHIEQGPVLYNEKIPIGIVEKIVGIAWVTVTIKGEENHAGTTPMDMRKDALVAAADVVSFVRKRAGEMAEKLSPSLVGTVGRLTVSPNGTNIVPGRVQMGIDIRDVAAGNMEDFRGEVLQMLDNIGEKYGVDVSVEMPFTHLPVSLSPEMVGAIERAAGQVQVRSRRMNSGAGHDSQNMAEKVKTGMIFVPSVKGVSHAPLEWTEWDDIENGVMVLTQTLKNLSSIGS